MQEIVITLPPLADGEDKSSALANRIRKNYRHVRKWAKRSQTNCFRLYDREIPQYPLTIDFYDGNFCVYYFSRTRGKEEPSSELQEEVGDLLAKVFAIKSDKVFWKTRAKHKETRQYEKERNARQFFNVLEYGVKFWINLLDYLDTGLFLDHRETRQLVAASVAGKRLLNLFAYTCSFSVQAAAAGATFTKSVDMSNTYTAWGEKNFLLNGLSLHHNPVVRADCLKFLKQEVSSGERYDVIVIDPPTISRSKKMDQLFDVQVDYVYLISQSLKLLSPGGMIYFSTNSRKFVFEEDYFDSCKILEISSKTLPLDFHDSKIHRCWKIIKTV